VIGFFLSGTFISFDFMNSMISGVRVIIGTVPR
jgi:hypothetical protein